MYFFRNNISKQYTLTYRSVMLYLNDIILLNYKKLTCQTDESKTNYFNIDNYVIINYSSFYFLI
jgi:hypothetical protein